MDLEISPGPTPEERAAILLALARLAPDAGPASEWWREGLREALLGELESEPLNRLAPRDTKAP